MNRKIKNIVVIWTDQQRADTLFGDQGLLLLTGLHPFQGNRVNRPLPAHAYAPVKRQTLAGR